MIKGIVSGYFNPLHRGHLEYIHGAKMECDYLIIIVNNDIQVKVKNSKPFMDEEHRCFIMNHIKEADEVILSIDEDKSVKETLKTLRIKYPNDQLTFFNSGDRIKKDLSISSEGQVCQEFNIKYVAIPMKKVYSSSGLLEKLS